MLNFRNSNLILGSLLLLMVVAYVVNPFPLGYILLPFLLWLLVVAYGCYRIDSGFFMEVLCKGEDGKKIMAMTFDDGPSAEHTPKILDILHAAGIKASFFCIGKNIGGNENILRRIHEEGHMIGNHSYSHHFGFDFFSAGRMVADLRQADASISAILNVTPRMFRPPYGVINPNVRKTILEGNYFPVGWNIRSFDTLIRNPKRLKDRIITRFSPGAVLLLHDSGIFTAEILNEIIHESQRQGYQWVTIDQLLNIKPYA